MGLPVSEEAKFVLTRCLALAVVALPALACSTTPAAVPDAGRVSPRDGGTDGPRDAGTCMLLDGSEPAVPEAGAMSLTALAVTAADASTSGLVPAFSPGIHDYYLQCAAGANDLTVYLKAPAGASGSISIETPAMPAQPLQAMGSPAPEQTLSLTVNEGQAIVVTATEGKATEEYWVRCLPHDFPSMQWVTHADSCTRMLGYYLVGDEQPIAPGGAAYAMVLDARGVPVWYFRAAATGVFDVDDVVDGAISFLQYPSSSAFEVHRLSPVATELVSATGVSLDPHELRSLPNGDFLVFSAELQTGVDLTGYPLALPDGGVEMLGPNGTIAPCDIMEVDREGNVVWRWVGTDHFDAVKDSTYRGFLESDGSAVADPFHCNSIDVDPENGNLLVSARNMDSVFYIDRSSGAVLWKLGGATYSKDDGTVHVTVTDPFFRQHDARLLPGWSSKCGGTGQISLFDDETGLAPPARAVVYAVSVGTGKEECETSGATVAWQRVGSVSSINSGSFRITSDGSRTIGWGQGGKVNLVFSEVDAEGHSLLDFYFTDNSSSYRSLKVPLGALDLDVMRSTAGLP
jgi:hypothetical protein